MKKILINASSENEIRVAITEDGVISSLHVESSSANQKRASIYKGVVTRIEPSLEAAFVDYGEEKQGFLPFKDISIAAISRDLQANERVSDHLSTGMELIVQVEKEERGNKGASLTTNISIAGQYLILLPFANNDRANGISRSLSSEQRYEAKELLDSIDVPDPHRVILRTASLGRYPKELQWNLDYLVRIWELVAEAAASSSQPCLLYKESDAVMKTIRDNLKDEVEALIIDNENVYKGASDLVAKIMPDQLSKLQHYNEVGSLFAHYQIERQIESVYSRNVKLKSGGEIVIDLTEALISIDVNSSRSTRGKDIEETALLTNLEAAEEIMRQLRLRDLGGLVVIDFIDMLSSTNRRQVEKRAVECSSDDRARVNFGRISKFGLLELSRQHLGNSLSNLQRVPCHVCGSIYHARTINSVCLSIVNLLEEDASQKGVSTLQVELSLDSATYLLNEHRADLNRIEARHGINITVTPNHKLAHPNYTIKALDFDHNGALVPSYKLRSKIRRPVPMMEKKMTKSEALLDAIAPETAAPKLGFWQRLFQKPKKVAVASHVRPKRNRSGESKRQGSAHSGRASRRAPRRRPSTN